MVYEFVSGYLSVPQMILSILYDRTVIDDEDEAVFVAHLEMEQEHHKNNNNKVYQIIVFNVFVVLFPSSADCLVVVAFK